MSKKSKVQTREILSGTRAIMVGFCEAQSANFLSEACESLFTQAERAKADNEGRQLFEARQALEHAGEQIRRFLDSGVKNQFKLCFPTRAAGSAEPDSPRSASDLGLVDEQQMELNVAVNSMSHRVESDHADLLYALTQRMALLNQGIKIEDDLAPYSARTFCTAYMKFVDHDNYEQAVKLVLLKVFERFFLRKLGGLYEELNQYLVSANVLPNLRHKANNLVQPRRRKSDQEEQTPKRRQEDVFKAIESILHADNVPIDPQRPVMPVEQVLGEILGLQQQQRAAASGDWLAAPSTLAFPATNTLALQQVLQVISTLFGMVNTETSVASPVKNLLSHLQTPYAQIALQDPDFLRDPDHVARQLFSSMLGASERFTDPDTEPSNELVQRIKSVVERIMNESQGDIKEDLDLFGELLHEFTDYIDSFEHKIKLTEQRSVQAAEGREKLRENQLKVEEIIQQKMMDESLPAPVTELITEVWSSFMTYTLLRHGEGSEQWKDAIKTIDTVLWYIEPKTNSAEKKLSGDIRQTLHEKLEAGMQNVGLDGGEIKSKLAALDLCQKLATENAAEHSAPVRKTAVNNAGEKPASPRHESPRDQAKTPAAATPQAPRNRIAMQKQAANSDSVKSSDDPDLLLGKLAKSLDREEPAKPAGKSASVIKPVRMAPQEEIDKVLSMKFGTWLHWNKPGEKPQEVKLTWYNSRTQNCMLSNHRGKEIAVVTANVIALGMIDGWIKVAEREKKKPLFERVLESIGAQAQTRETGGNTASYGTKH